MSERDPETQFQIFDDVLYVEEGIITKVVGYIWDKDDLPKILAYQLNCGCAVPATAIRQIHTAKQKLKRFRP